MYKAKYDRESNKVISKNMVLDFDIPSPYDVISAQGEQIELLRQRVRQLAIEVLELTAYVDQLEQIVSEVAA